ncbi:MAG TPA: hypothetical protein VMH79_05130 [Thermoanaerobaculia bacterium]|nr:hypothetical protein [Thermoanaerobaculia bacterium]
MTPATPFATTRGPASGSSGAAIFRACETITGKPSGFEVERILGEGDFRVPEYTIVSQGRSVFTVSLMEFRDGKAALGTPYSADPFEAPARRGQWSNLRPGRDIQQPGISMDTAWERRPVTR